MQLKRIIPIRYEISCIRLNMLYAAINSAVTHLQTVIYGGGGHIEHVVNNMLRNICRLHA